MMQISRSIIDRQKRGFTLVEVILAGSIMIILCVGTLTVFSHAVKINTGNNLRAQAQSVLQQEIEYYRGLKFVPNVTDADLTAGTHTRPNRTSADLQAFAITVVVDNDPYGTSPGEVLDADCKFKQITITVVPVVTRAGWLADLKTNVTIQRVRSN